MRTVNFQLVLGDKILPVRRIEWRNGKPYRADPYPPDESKWFYLDTKHGYTLRESTGLKDKNGVEIYEGDICRVLAKEWAGDDFALKLLIEWDDANLGYVAKTLDNFGRKSFYDDTIYAPDVWADQYEVIGNIYENPELLSE